MAYKKKGTNFGLIWFNVTKYSVSVVGIPKRKWDIMRSQEIQSTTHHFAHQYYLVYGSAQLYTILFWRSASKPCEYHNQIKLLVFYIKSNLWDKIESLYLYCSSTKVKVKFNLLYSFCVSSLKMLISTSCFLSTSYSCVAIRKEASCGYFSIICFLQRGWDILDGAQIQLAAF